MFHVSKLRLYIANNDEKFPMRESRFFYDFTDDPEAEWIVAEIDNHAWVGKRPKLELHMNWEAGDSTWEPLQTVNELMTLDNYLDLMGVSMPKELPRKGHPKS